MTREDSLVVRSSIEIAAPPARVWQVLNDARFTSDWASEFGAAGPIESDFRLGSAVLWRNAAGEVYVTGRVTALEPEKLLRFTVSPRATPAALRPRGGRHRAELLTRRLAEGSHSTPR